MLAEFFKFVQITEVQGPVFSFLRGSAICADPWYASDGNKQESVPMLMPCWLRGVSTFTQELCIPLHFAFHLKLLISKKTHTKCFLKAISHQRRQRNFSLKTVVHFVVIHASDAELCRVGPCQVNS